MDTKAKCEGLLKAMKTTRAGELVEGVTHYTF